MKFYYEEIAVLKDGTSAQALFEKPSEREAIAAASQAFASALINPNLVSIAVEAKNSEGFVYRKDAYVVEE